MRNARIDKVKKAAVRNGSKFQGAVWVLYTQKQIWKTPVEVSKHSGISIWQIYSWKQQEPDFPYRYIGKKRFQVDIIEFEKWLHRLSLRQKRQDFMLPSGQELYTSIVK